jgi:signal transduction histidine kinase
MRKPNALGLREPLSKPDTSKVTVGLVSNRKSLDRLCREVLAEVAAAHWRIMRESASSGLRRADLVVWDLQPGSSLPDPASLSGDQGNIFLVHESHVESLCRWLPIAAAVNILVEPAEEVVVRKFLERAFRRHLDHSTRSDPRRSERDELFQTLLLAGFRLREAMSERVSLFRRTFHDLSAPLTALNGYCGLLLDQRLGPLTAEQLAILRHMDHSVARLSSLLSAALHLSQGTMEPAQLHVEAGDMTVTVQQAVAEVIPNAAAREVDIRLNIAQPAEALYFDPVLMEKVLSCLLANACRFTAAGGAVEVKGYPVQLPSRLGGSHGTGPRTRKSGDGAPGFRIDILDFGPPIAPEDVARVFDLSAAYRGGADRSGGGLELAMCKMIVEAHRGRLSVDSGENGTVFSVVMSCGQTEVTAE